MISVGIKYFMHDLPCDVYVTRDSALWVINCKWRQNSKPPTDGD